jgi:imidazolonepropionase-like amidohydrolase
MSTGLAASLARIGQGETRRLAATRLTSIIERAQRSFGRIAIGSDAPLVPFGRGFIDEIETLVASGVPAAQVLRWATAGGAMALGIDPDLGTVETGKLADLVIVDGDPLTRIRDLRGVRIVVVGGNVVWGTP